MSDPNLKQKTAKGLLWGSLSNGAQQLFGLAFGIVLSNLLTPDDYGMVGQLAIFTLIAATIQESGFTAALVNRPTMEHRDYNAVFWCILPISLALYALLFFSAPLISWYYNEPVLVPLSRYVFLSFVISGLGIVPAARLLKTMRVRERTLSNLTALCISGGVGIALAYNGHSYWGIATQSLVYIGTNTLLYWSFARWRPTLTFDFRPIREMVGFSSKLLVTNILLHVNNNFFSVLLGRFFNPAAVGNYVQANKWNFTGHGLVTGMVNGVAQPLFVETRGDDERQARVFRKMMRFTCFMAFPVMFGLAIIARELIVVTITEKWLGAAQMLSILCVSGAFLPVTALYTQFLLSRGFSDIYMKGLFGLVVVQALTAIALYPLGVIPMLWGYVVVNLIWTGVWHYFIRRELRISYRQGFLDLAPFLGITLVTMAATYFAIGALEVTPLVSMLLKIVMAAVVYVVLLWIAGAEILKESVAFLLKKHCK